MNRYTAFILPLTLLLAAPAAQAADERQQLREQRAAIEARFKAANEACEQRFQVNACRDEARATRNAQLRPIQSREEVLMSEERRARAAAQSQRVADRQREFASEEGRRRTEALQSPKEAPSAMPRGALPSRSLPVDPETHAKDVRRQSDAAARAADDAREQAGKRQRLVLQHQQDFQKRQEEKAAAASAARTRAPGKPLAIPSAAEIEAAAASAARR